MLFWHQLGTNDRGVALPANSYLLPVKLELARYEHIASAGRL